MSNNLNHSPADILRYLLINLEIGTLPVGNGLWPICVNDELTTPDNTITLYDTTGTSTRYMVEGKVIDHHGIQIRVRSKDQSTGYVKISTIKQTISEVIYRDSISISTSDYCIQCVTNITDIIPLKESQVSSRWLHIINCQVPIKYVS